MGWQDDPVVDDQAQPWDADPIVAERPARPPRTQGTSTRPVVRAAEEWFEENVGPGVDAAGDFLGSAAEKVGGAARWAFDKLESGAREVPGYGLAEDKVLRPVGEFAQEHVTAPVGRAAMRLGQGMDTSGALPGGADVAQESEEIADLPDDVAGPIGAGLLTLPVGGPIKQAAALSLLDPNVTTAQALGPALAARYAPAAARASMDVVPAVRQYLGQKAGNVAVAQGRRFLANRDPMAATREPLSNEAVREAFDSGAIKPFRTTADAYQRLEDLSAQQGRRYGEILAELRAAGVEGPNARAVADDLFAREAELRLNTGADKRVPRTFRSEAQNILNVADESFEQGVNPSYRPNLEQMERIKQDLQLKARFDRLNNNPREKAYQEISSTVRQANEDAIAAQAAKAPEAAAEFIPTKQRLGRLIEARDESEKGMAAAARRRGVSLTDTIMMAGGMSSGNIVSGLVAGAGNNFLRTRGTSAFAVMANALEKKLLAQGGQPGAIAGHVRALEAAAKRGDQQYAVTAYVLAQQHPEARELLQKAAELQQQPEGDDAGLAVAP